MADIKMTLGWVIAYVDDPAEAARFYERTFGLRVDFIAGDEFAQLDTGPTKLGFASYALSRKNFEGGVQRAGAQPANVEITLVAEDVDGAFRAAVEAGCAPLPPPSPPRPRRRARPPTPRARASAASPPRSGRCSSSPRRCRAATAPRRRSP